MPKSYGEYWGFTSQGTGPIEGLFAKWITKTTLGVDAGGGVLGITKEHPKNIKNKLHVPHGGNYKINIITIVIGIFVNQSKKSQGVRRIRQRPQETIESPSTSKQR